MPTHGKGSKIFLAEYDVSGEGRSFDLKWDQDTVAKKTFGLSAQEYSVGMIGASISHKGIYDLSATSWERWLYDNLGSFTGKGITAIPGVPALGGICYNGEVKEASSGRPVNISDIVATDADYQVHGMLGRAQIIEYEIDAAVGAQTGAGVNIGVASASEMWIVTIHCVEFNGSGTYTIKLQESQNDGSPDAYADVTGASLAATAIGSLVTTIAGARETWVRVVTTVAGGTPTAKFIVAVSIVPLQ